MERNITLDYFKLLLSILIIGLHTRFMAEIPLIGYGIQQGLTRIAVPCFFIINGYFLQPILNDPKKIKSYITRLLIVYLTWMIIYIPFHYMGRISIDVMPNLAATIFSYIFGWGPLWYISALIMSVFILFFLKKWNINDKILGIIFFILYIIGYSLQRLYLINIDFQFYALTRTFLFIGLPFIFIGYFIKGANIEDEFKVSLKTYLLTTILILCVIVESYLPLYFNRATDYYIVLPILCPILFIIILRKGKYISSNSFIAKLSSAIYFSHMLILFLVQNTFSYTNTKLFMIVLPLSFLSSILIVCLNKYLRIFLP